MRMTRQRGFTLLEVAVCVLILGLLTGAASLSLGSLKKNVDFETWVDQLVAFDRQARQRAEQQGRPWQIMIDVDQSRLVSQPIEAGQARYGLVDEGTVLELPRGWTLINAITDDDLGPSTTGGQFPVRVSTRGLTPTYAIQLENELNQPRWLLTSGASGQWLETDDEGTVQDIFATLQDASRHDAD